MTSRKGGPVAVPRRSGPWHTAQLVAKSSAPRATTSGSRMWVVVVGASPPTETATATMPTKITAPAPNGIKRDHRDWPRELRCGARGGGVLATRVSSRILSEQVDATQQHRVEWHDD